MRKFIYTLLGVSLCFSAFAEQATKESPNILIIMADDVGQGDLSCYGATAISTPNLDAFAKDGVKFNAGYTSAATCTPTRFSMLTGLYAFRQKGTGIAPPNAAAIIKDGTTTFPQLLQKAGYKTAVIGKWHLGLGEKKPDWNGELKPGPLERGFDYAFIIPNTNDRVPTAYVENHRLKNLDPSDPIEVLDKPKPNSESGITLRDTLRLDWSFGHNNTVHNGIGRMGWCYGGKSALIRDEDMTVDFVDVAKKWLTENKDNKFFMFFAAINIHVPRMPNERFQGKSMLGLRGDAMLEFDWSVGELRKTLEELGLAENTLVVICSDNGATLDNGYKDNAVELAKKHNHSPSGRFRGFKSDSYEGGARTPFISYWKGTITPQTSDLPISTIDLGRTLCKIAGVEVPEGVLPDSLDMTDTLLAKDNAKARDFIFFEGATRSCSYQDGTWKLIAPSVATLKKTGNAKKKFELYKVPEDDVEQNNVFAKEPEVAETMLKKLGDFLEMEIKN